MKMVSRGNIGDYVLSYAPPMGVLDCDVSLRQETTKVVWLSHHRTVQMEQTLSAYRQQKANGRAPNGAQPRSTVTQRTHITGDQGSAAV